MFLFTGPSWCYREGLDRKFQSTIDRSKISIHDRSLEIFNPEGRDRTFSIPGPSGEVSRRAETSFLCPFSYATLRRRGTQFWGSICAVFGALVSRQPPPANPFSKPPSEKDSEAPPFTFLRSRANGSLTSSSFTGFFHSQKARFVHSHIHLAITGECFIHSLHSREYIHSIHANSDH